MNAIEETNRPIVQGQVEELDTAFRLPTVAELFAMSPEEQRAALRGPTFAEIVAPAQDEELEKGDQI